MVEQPGERGPAVVLGVVAVGEFGGVNAQQAVQPVAAGRVLGEQAGIGELAQRPVRIA
ncbi:hypothetical protein [Actinoplanes sp. NPDC049118]|uniref:hypothetical protein n=1 Tax=Actinoplanes sp. NPDC049118 TaxID=3155769 RepID=UPI003408CB9F